MVTAGRWATIIVMTTMTGMTATATMTPGPAIPGRAAQDRGHGG